MPRRRHNHWNEGLPVPPLHCYNHVTSSLTAVQRCSSQKRYSVLVLWFGLRLSWTLRYQYGTKSRKPHWPACPSLLVFIWFREKHCIDSPGEKTNVIRRCCRSGHSYDKLFYRRLCNSACHVHHHYQKIQNVFHQAARDLKHISGASTIATKAR
jgi:hypothetical protein